MIRSPMVLKNCQKKKKRSRTHELSCVLSYLGPPLNIQYESEIREHTARGKSEIEEMAIHTKSSQRSKSGLVPSTVTHHVTRDGRSFFFFVINNDNEILEITLIGVVSMST